MTNPWLKKNPFLSLWLSGANTIVGRARAQAGGAARRQGAEAVSTTTRAVWSAWTPWLSPPAAPKRKRRR
jgi:hypothetical protein